MDNLDNKISDTIKDISQKGSSLVEQTQTKVLDIANNVLSTQNTSTPAPPSPILMSIISIIETKWP